MKKIASFLLCAFLTVSAALSAADREHTLKVYNWADYIDEDLIAEFEKWYEEQTGEKVQIVYQLFDINEVMLSKIEKGHEDYDVVCPSDYIIERMLRQDLLLPIDRDFGNAPDYTGNISPFIMNMLRLIDAGGKDANKYAVPYMWGTTGILYNPKYVSPEEVKSWEVLRNPKYAGKIYVKDAFRDVYTALIVYLKKDEIDSGKLTLDQAARDASDESIALVENWLNSMKDGVQGWEADFGKELMTKEKGWLNLSWSGDAKWAIDEAANIGVTLDYAVPQEGSNVWFDAWVIPKYARNVKAARYFIDFMCKPENAIRNMDVIGYVSAVGGEEILEAQLDPENCRPVDASYFFGPEATAVPVDYVLYPDKSVIDRCTMMHDSADRTEALMAMWSRVKGDNASTATYVIIALAVLAIVAFMLLGRKKSHKRKSSGKRR